MKNAVYYIYYYDVSEYIHITQDHHQSYNLRKRLYYVSWEKVIDYHLEVNTLKHASPISFFKAIPIMAPSFSELTQIPTQTQ